MSVVYTIDQNEDISSLVNSTEKAKVDFFCHLFSITLCEQQDQAGANLFFFFNKSSSLYQFFSDANKAVSIVIQL